MPSILNDRTEKKRQFPWERIITAVAVMMTLFQIYTTIFGIFESTLQRSLHLLFAIVLSFMICRVSKAKDPRVPWYDLIFIILALASFGYVVVNSGDIASRLAYVTPLTGVEMVVGVVGILVLWEASRRMLGRAFAIIMAAFLLYALFGQHLPGMLRHRGYDLGWVIDHVFYTTEGILGIPLGVSATYIFIFILFATFLEKTGAGDFFNQVSLALMGRFRGGPAKTAVVASGFMGMLSGSAVANVVTTGAFTIPLMKKLGYKPHFAGAVEACASSGGQFAPPVMGAAAFIIAEFTGIPYIKVAAAAAIPALMYFFSIGLQVHFRAIKEGIEGLPRDQLPSFTKEFAKGFHYVLPLVALVYFLIAGYTPLKAGLYAIVTLIIVTFARNPRFIKPVDFLKIFEASARTILEVAIACAAAGVIIGIISLTGLGLRLSTLIMSLAGGNSFLALLFTMVTAVILGMGLPTVAAYIIQAALLVPALVQLGIPLLAAHLFAFYYAIISAVTPPVALAAYAGAGVAGADVNKTALTAFKLALAAFIVPFMFAYGPALILIGEPIEIVSAACTAFVGIFALAASIEGWLVKRANLLERILLFAAALCLIKPGISTDTAGIALIVLAFILQKFRKSEVKNEVKSNLPGGVF
ncbi:TRAP transporter permease [Desulfofundulus salinus]|nr:TRAP transporter permease [Desulfofundulus salinum]